ncbi:uncharacterized protein LOC112541791, partial [Python bivittatus]|uniref:Uncharacterized protein LOC112541791 n=1 Tax=Python bivittatus TaxID=176946 RepID=A0A9F5JAE3_PYTBI
MTAHAAPWTAPLRSALAASENKAARELRGADEQEARQAKAAETLPTYTCPGRIPACLSTPGRCETARGLRSNSGTASLPPTAELSSRRPERQRRGEPQCCRRTTKKDAGVFGSAEPPAFGAGQRWCRDCSLAGLCSALAPLSCRSRANLSSGRDQRATSREARERARRTMPETGCPLRTLPAFLALVWTAASLSLAGGAGSEQQIPLSVVKLWASAFGGEIRSIAAKYSGSQLLQKEEFSIVPTSELKQLLIREELYDKLFLLY